MQRELRSLRDSGITWLAISGLDVVKMQRRAGYDAIVPIGRDIGAREALTEPFQEVLAHLSGCLLGELTAVEHRERVDVADSFDVGPLRNRSSEKEIDRTLDVLAERVADLGKVDRDCVGVAIVPDPTFPFGATITLRARAARYVAFKRGLPAASYSSHVSG